MYSWRVNSSCSTIGELMCSWRVNISCSTIGELVYSWRVNSSCSTIGELVYSWLKKIAPSRGRREHFRGISCEKSLFYFDQIYTCIMKRKFKHHDCDDQQFHQYQQNKQPPLTPNHWTQKKCYSSVISDPKTLVFFHSTLCLIDYLNLIL
jgi:hypothetical protein